VAQEDGVAGRVADTFAALVGALAVDADLTEFPQLVATRCRALLGVRAVVVLLADQEARLSVRVSADQPVTRQFAEVHTVPGPLLDAHRRAAPVAVADLAAAQQRWPRLAPVLVAAGLPRAHAVPFTSGGQALGALGLFHDDDLAEQAPVAQSLAQVLGAHLALHRAVQLHRTRADQLTRALDSRVLIEQAKGVMAERLQIDVNAAFSVLRGFARRTNQRLHSVARAVVTRELDIAATTKQ
jgi:hypothetical protein